MNDVNCTYRFDCRCLECCGRRLLRALMNGNKKNFKEGSFVGTATFDGKHWSAKVVRTK